jgi:hypothetical protein
VTLLVKLGTFSTERFPASAGAQVFLLDIVARVAVGVVVMHGLFNRVPGGCLSHLRVFLSTTEILKSLSVFSNITPLRDG